MSVWDIVKRAFWDFGSLDVFDVSLDEFKQLVSSSLNLILDTATHRCYTKCEWKEGTPHGKGDFYDCLRTGCVLMVKKTQPEVLPPEKCLVFVNYEYTNIQEFAKYIKVEFKSMFGDSCFCPSCERQFLPHELRDHQAYCTANQTFAEIFSPQEMELFWSYELRMEETEQGPLKLCFCLVTRIKCELCGVPYEASDKTYHEAVCERTGTPCRYVIIRYYKSYSSSEFIGLPSCSSLELMSISCKGFMTRNDSIETIFERVTVYDRGF